ncbi:MAG TPA: DUF6624 domain-containing protein [Acidimicrobiales bacterium]|nr:DUF6624 domain-containing protein [Acidimicrobiales bacterium]
MRPEPRRPIEVVGVLLLLALLFSLMACSGSDDGEEAKTSDAETDGGDGVEEPELRDELLELMDADQAERNGEIGGNNDTDRTDRLREIIDEHGWPTFDLVGKEGTTAAWVIAQHTDFDVDFQQEAFELMEAAVADDQADASELAYLDDRIAVNTGQPQRYGTQVRCAAGRAHPATPLIDPDGVDDLRAEVGLDPLHTYLTEFAKGCSEEP